MQVNYNWAIITIGNNDRNQVNNEWSIIAVGKNDRNEQVKKSIMDGNIIRDKPENIIPHELARRKPKN